MKKTEMPNSNELESMKVAGGSYSVRREFSPNHAAIVFEFDLQSEEELLRDFPWLRLIGASAFQHHQLSNIEPEEGYSLRTRHNQSPLPNAVPNRLWSWLIGLFSPGFSPSVLLHYRRSRLRSDPPVELI